jgi:DNA-binding transcriptional regulator GbsR (MarR family)
MKGFVSPELERPASEDGDWLALCAEAVGNVIEFWGFKRNHGRVWAFLYLGEGPRTAAEIQAGLGLSKGAVSMITRELEHWRVVSRVRAPEDSSWRFAAETELMQMITRVIRERESVFISRVREDLARAEKLAKEGGAPAETLKRIRRMRQLADTIEGAIQTFLRTARLDLRGAAGVLKDTSRRVLARRKR